MDAVVAVVDAIPENPVDPDVARELGSRPGIAVVQGPAKSLFQSSAAVHQANTDSCLEEGTLMYVSFRHKCDIELTRYAGRPLNRHT